MDIKYPEFVDQVLSVLRENGHCGYIVGGSLRDILLGIEPGDWDVTTSALPERVSELFLSEGYTVIPTGIKHGTVTVMCDGEPIEITTFRHDGEYKDARHPSDVTFTSDISSDLSRRDFTVNAIAYSPTEGLIDLFGGKDDIKNQVIRCVGDPEKRFSEDALRIMRAFRFMSKLGFEIDRETLAGAEKMRWGLLKVSRERILAELSGLLLGKHAGDALELMATNGILTVIFENFDVALPPSRAIDRLSFSLPLRFAAVFINGSYGLRNGWIGSLKMSNELRDRILKLLETKNVKPELSFYGARRFLVRYGLLSGDALELLSLTCFDVESFAPFLEAVEKEEFPRNIRELALDGEDLLSLGVEPGREIGNVLEHLFECVLRDPQMNTKEKLQGIVLSRM